MTMEVVNCFYEEKKNAEYFRKTDRGVPGKGKEIYKAWDRVFIFEKCVRCNRN